MGDQERGPLAWAGYDVSVVAETNAAPVAPAGTVARVVRLMAVLAEAEAPLSIAEIASRLGLPRPTAHRLVNLLREEGLVEADPMSHRYQPGGEFLRIGSLVAGRHSLSELAAPVMRELVRQSRETCLLGLYLPATHQMMFAAQEASQHALGYRVELMQPIPVAWGASGRAILAYLSDAEIEAVVARGESSPVSGEPLPTSAALRREITTVRERGYAYTRAQKIPESRGIAAPIIGADGIARGSLCLTIPEIRFDEAKLPALADLIIRHTAQLSALLGYRRSA